MKSKSNEKLMSDDRKESDLWKDKPETIVKVRMGFSESAGWKGLSLCNYFMHTKCNVCKGEKEKSSCL